MSDADRGVAFDVTHGGHSSDVLVAGFTQFGLAGLTAVDYLSEHLELEPTGHIQARGVPSVTPFENGRPRHHTRIFSGADSPVSVLVGEYPVPVWAADTFTESLFAWLEAAAVSEVVVVAGVPIAHAPDDHRTFYVATDDYRDRRLAEVSLPPMGAGFLDGVNGTLLERGLDTDLAVGVLVTPVHAQVPDVEASLRLVESVADVYALDVDTAPLQSFAEEIEDYYAELHERMEADASQPPRALPEDRMYM